MLGRGIYPRAVARRGGALARPRISVEKLERVSRNSSRGSRDKMVVVEAGSFLFYEFLIT